MKPAASVQARPAFVYFVSLVWRALQAVSTPAVCAILTLNLLPICVERCARLASAFREKDLPVVLVNVAGGAPGRNEQPRHEGELPANWATLVPAMTPQHNDLTITKKTWGAFHDTALHDELQKRGITQVVICGIATSIGVESTAREAYASGYNVTLAVDAMTDLNSDTHENSIKRVFPRLGETGSYNDVIAKLNAL